MFYGQHKKTLDDKDRIIVPAEFRKVLETGEDEGAPAADKKSSGSKALAFFITITPSMDRCLSLFPVVQFTRLFLNFKPYESFIDENVQNYTRLVVGRSHQVCCDKQGRIHIPGHLKEDAGIQKDVVLVGLFDHAEIWDRERWKQFNIEKRAAITEVARKVHQNQSDDGS